MSAYVPSPDAFRDAVLVALAQGFETGAVALLVDPMHPLNAGVPMPPALMPVLVPMRATLYRDRLGDERGATFRVPYLGQRGVMGCDIAWEAVFAVMSGAQGKGTNIAVPGGRFPAWFATRETWQARIMAYAARLGLGARVPHDGVGWIFRGAAAVVARGASDMWLPSSPREAVEHLLGLPADTLVLLADGTAEGVRQPAGAHAAKIEVTLGQASQCPRYALQDDGLAIEVQVQGGETAEVFLPWRAFVGLRAYGTAYGWLWPQHFGPTFREHVAGLLGDEWSHVAHAEVIPVEAMREGSLHAVARLVPWFVLSPVPERNKRLALGEAMRVGGAIVLANPGADGVEAPEVYRDKTVIVAPLGNVTAVEANPVVDATGLRVSIPDPNGNAVRLRLPWDAICVIACDDPSALQAWPEDASEALLALLRGNEALAAGRTPEPHEGMTLAEDPNAEPVSIDSVRGPSGWVLAAGTLNNGQSVVLVEQPIGPEVAPGKRPCIHMELQIPTFSTWAAAEA